MAKQNDVTLTLSKTDIHNDLFVVDKVPSDEKARTNSIQKLRTAVKKRDYAVHDRKDVGVFVAKTEAASKALSEAHPITRKREGGLDIDELLKNAS